MMAQIVGARVADRHHAGRWKLAGYRLAIPPHFLSVFHIQGAVERAEADHAKADQGAERLDQVRRAAGHGRPSCRVARRPGAAPGGTVEGARQAETGAAAMAAPSFGPVMHAL
jgi:hypothetical protein